MEIQKLKNQIIINGNFDIKSTLECGQIFSFFEKSENNFVVVSTNKVAEIEYSQQKTIIKTDDSDYFYNFFDLQTNYEQIKKDIIKLCPKFEMFIKRDLRILKQNPHQTIISFIVSANNNIKRIKLILNKICQKCSDYLPKANCYAFPTLEQLSILSTQDYKDLGAGYRSDYLYQSVKLLQSPEFDINVLKTLSTPELKNKLLKLKGVGPKVADCILFFGFSRTDAFPTDTWIRKAYYQFFDCGKKTDEQISAYFCNIFKNLSGYAQQYLYDYMLNIQQ